MLTLAKNEAVTNVMRQEVSIRLKEIEWYTTNYNSIIGQAAMLAGFSFSQLLTPLPEDHKPSYMRQFWYLGLTCVSIGIELVVIFGCTYMSNWGPGLALRGASGGRDMHRAVAALRDFQMLLFFLFMLGWVTFFISSLFQLWIYYDHTIATICLIPMYFFLVAIVYYAISITYKMRIPYSATVEGKMDMLEAYEGIGDLDRHLGAGGVPLHAAETNQGGWGTSIGW